MAGMAFGISLPKALHADNLTLFERELAAKLKQVTRPCDELPAQLSDRLKDSGISEEVDRLTTARSANQLCANLAGKTAREQGELLDGFEPQTSGRAVMASVGSAGEVCRLLQDNLVFGPFEQLRRRKDSLEGASELLDDVVSVLRQDELNKPLVKSLRSLAEQAQRLLNPPAPKGVVLVEVPLSSVGKGTSLGDLEQAVEAVRKALEGASEEVTLSGQLRVVDRERQ